MSLTRVECIVSGAACGLLTPLTVSSVLDAQIPFWPLGPAGAVLLPIALLLIEGGPARDVPAEPDRPARRSEPADRPIDAS